MPEREFTWDDKLKCNQTIAEIIKLCAQIDMDVVRDILRDGAMYDAVEPVIDPTAYFRNRRDTHAALSVVRGIKDFMGVLDQASPVDWRALHR